MNTILQFLSHGFSVAGRKGAGGVQVNMLDRWIYPDYLNDSETLLRGRIIVGLSMFNLSLCFASQVVIYTIITRDIGQISLGHWIVLFFIVFYIGLLYLFKRHGSFFWTGNTLCLASFSGTMVAIFIGGVYPSPLGIAIVLVPVLAFLIPGRQSGVFWTFTVLLSQFFFVALAQTPWWGEPNDAIMLQRATIPASLLVASMTVGIIAGSFYIIEKLNLDLRKELFLERRLLEYTAAHDGLTGLYNRRAFDTIIKDLIQSPECESFALLYLDLNDFKPINDNLGHEVGDTLLQEFAHRLTQSMREDDVIARMGGDEFAIIIKRASQAAQIERVLTNVLEDVAKPVDVPGGQLRLQTSVGVAFWPENGEGPKEIFRKADEAMYKSKRLHLPYSFF